MNKNVKIQQKKIDSTSNSKSKCSNLIKILIYFEDQITIFRMGFL